MEKLDKGKSIQIMAGQGYATSYMAQVIMSDPELSDRKANLLKYAAHLVRSGFTVNMATKVAEPCISYRHLTWETFEIIGKAFYNDVISPEQVLEVAKQYAIDD